MVTRLEQAMPVYQPEEAESWERNELTWVSRFQSDHTRVGTPVKQWHYLFLSFFIPPKDYSLEDYIFSSLCLKVCQCLFIALWMKMKPLKIPSHRWVV